MQQPVTQDAEVHRQHVRLRIPIGLEIDGVRHSADDWSVAGFAVAGSVRGHQPGDRFPARLILPFEDFELTLGTECELVYELPDGSRSGGRFLNLSAGQLALFRYIVDAYLSGEMVAGADLLAVIGREHAGERRVRGLYDTLANEQQSRGRRVQRALGLLLLGVAGLGLGLAAAAGVYERYVVVDTDRAVIEAPLYPLRATAAGIVEAAGTGLLRPGDAAATLRGGANNGAAVVTLPSPCECVLDEWVVQPGAMAQAGQVVATLVAADRPLVVRAELPLEQARRLRVGQIAEVSVPGQPETYRGQIEAIDFKIRPERPGEARRLPEGALPVVPVIVRPDRPFDFEDQGFAVSVRFL